MARRYDDGLAYGDIPERWDRARFERFGGGGGGPTRFEEDYRYTERDRPGRQDVMVSDRIESRGPRGTYEERDRFVEEERFTPGRRRRRTDRELFGDVDPRELANTALTRYEPPPPARPEFLRRRSSFEHFDRPTIPRYEVEERRIPVYRPAPYEENTYRREVDIEESRGRGYYEPTEYREVEIRREKSRIRPSKSKTITKSKTVIREGSSSSSSSSVNERESIHESRRGGRESVHESLHESSHSRGGGRQSVAESFNETKSRGGGGSAHESFHESARTSGGREQSVHESFHESVHGGNASVAESIQETVKKFKKGKTRMPKRLVRREAIMDLGYPFEEEEFFFVLTIALEKEQIDEVIRISETYNDGEKETSIKIKESSTNVPEIVEPVGEREVVTRTEWINPPSVIGGRVRSRSHAGHRHRRSINLGGGEEIVTDRRTVLEEAPFAPIAPAYDGEALTTVRSGGALVIHRDRDRDRDHRSDREIRDEIARLEAERRAVRLEREADERRGLVIRSRDRPREEVEFDAGVRLGPVAAGVGIEFDRARPAREVVGLYDERDEIVERRDVLQVEKDRKGRMALVRER